MKDLISADCGVKARVLDSDRASGRKQHEARSHSVPLSAKSVQLKGSGSHAFQFGSTEEAPKVLVLGIGALESLEETSLTHQNMHVMF